MTKITLMDKYPLLSLDIAKNDTAFKNVPEILEYFKDKVKNDAIAKFIGIFNHYEHTQSLESGSIDQDIIDAQNIVFCFGEKIPNALILAARPRSIAIAEYADKFVVTFMEAPMASMTDKMESWVKELSK